MAVFLISKCAPNNPGKQKDGWYIHRVPKVTSVSSFPSCSLDVQLNDEDDDNQIVSPHAIFTQYKQHNWKTLIRILLTTIDSFNFTIHASSFQQRVNEKLGKSI